MDRWHLNYVANLWKVYFIWKPAKLLCTLFHWQCFCSYGFCCHVGFMLQNCRFLSGMPCVLKALLLSLRHLNHNRGHLWASVMFSFRYFWYHLLSPMAQVRELNSTCFQFGIYPFIMHSLYIRKYVCHILEYKNRSSMGFLVLTHKNSKLKCQRCWSEGFKR